jgi:hypothetical protein
MKIYLSRAVVCTVLRREINNMTNREAHEKAAGMGLDDMFFSFNNMDPDAECIEYKVPNECYEDYGADLDGCSRQENEGCKGCRCLIEIK